MGKKHSSSNGDTPAIEVAPKTDAVATKKKAPQATERTVQVAAPERSAMTGAPPDPNYPQYRIEPEQHMKLASFEPDASEHYHSGKDVKDELDLQRKRIEDLQARLYAERKQGLLIVLQAMDTGGKDGTVRGVFQGVNPQGCQVWSFKAPSSEELEHDFLWRYHKKVPERGMITIFNRSHYE
ncbi:MAG: polyphosphate kinase 2 family protein, partial [Herpetosiphonaceae bacterium]|nr:polyphosphate kinase 2 family protein [Herpetosiphonaceae bacterium]